ncbi:hypothetical protein [Halobacillus litoralis]|uniref:hypothetical protein n=1 Tax=Halobacillus litoralis TaxID=45668 RepID=UPI001CFC4FBA|nr:hypothetical protein [Halobacillus litoralis]
MYIGGGPLPCPLRKYEKMITDIVWELGVYGKADEFIREGKIAVYRVQEELQNIRDDVAKELMVYKSIKTHLLTFL